MVHCQLAIQALAFVELFRAICVFDKSPNNRLSFKRGPVRVVDHPTANRDEDTTTQAALAIFKGSPRQTSRVVPQEKIG
jgi:hypothetical protein